MKMKILLVLSLFLAGCSIAPLPTTMTYKQYTAMSLAKQKRFAQNTTRVVTMGDHLAYDIPDRENAFFACSDINMWGLIEHGNHLAHFTGANEKWTGSVKIGDHVFPCHAPDSVNLGTLEPGESKTITIK